MQPNLVSGQAIGSCIAVANSTDLANLSSQGIALGTQVYNIAVGAYFVLTASTASLSPDSVVAVSGIVGQRWIVASAPVAATDPGWFGSLKAFFQGQTGLSSLAWSPMIEEDLTKSGLTASQQGFQCTSGTGAGFVYTNLIGGVIKATGPTTGAGYADYAAAPQSQTPWQIIGNARTKRWMTAYRIAIGKAPTSASLVSAGVVIGTSTFVGIGYAGAQTNWQYVRGTTPANISDTGTAISVDSTGLTGYLTMLVGNFDLAHVAICPDAVTSLALTNVEAITNIPSAISGPYVYNEGDSAGDIYFLDKILTCVEL